MRDYKRFSSLQARAALAGVELQASRTDAEQWTFIASAGALTQELSTLDDVEAWLTRLSAQVEAKDAA